MVVKSKEKTQILRAPIDTDLQQVNNTKKSTKYTTRGGSFDTNYKASVGLQLVEFEDKGK